MAAGKVKWFNDERGYGLISVDDHSKDAYVHYTDVGEAQTLSSGLAVEFTLEKGDKLDRAREVVPASEAPPSAAADESPAEARDDARADTSENSPDNAPDDPQGDDGES